jgi:predicted DNA-binding transcriptional regulator YafY
MDEAVGAVLRMGADAEVLEPEWLRQSILAAAQAIIARYSSDSVAALPG